MRWQYPGYDSSDVLLVLNLWLVIVTLGIVLDVPGVRLRAHTSEHRALRMIVSLCALCRPTNKGLARRAEPMTIYNSTT